MEASHQVVIPLHSTALPPVAKTWTPPSNTRIKRLNLTTRKTTTAKAFTNPAVSALVAPRVVAPPPRLPATKEDPRCRHHHLPRQVSRGLRNLLFYRLQCTTRQNANHLQSSTSLSGPAATSPVKTPCPRREKDELQHATNGNKTYNSLTSESPA